MEPLKPMKHPLIAEIDKFVERKLKLLVAEVNRGAHSKLMGISAQLCCACADGDVFLLEKVIDQIKNLKITPTHNNNNNSDSIKASKVSALHSSSPTGKAQQRNLPPIAAASTPSASLSKHINGRSDELPPFLFGPFGLLHFAAFSNDANIAETVLLNQSTIEKIMPVNANFAATVPPYSPAAAAAHSHVHAEIHPHLNPYSIHFYTHLANGSQLISPNTVDGSTALHVAAAHHNLLLCRLLIGCGSTVRPQRTIIFKNPSSSAGAASNQKGNQPQSDDENANLSTTRSTADGARSHNANSAMSSKKLATPLYDALLSAGVKLANICLDLKAKDILTSSVEIGASSTAFNSQPPSDNDKNNFLASESTDEYEGKARENRENSNLDLSLKQQLLSSEAKRIFTSTVLTVPSDPSDFHTNAEIANALEKQSCLVHPFFSTVALLLNNGADSSLVACPSVVFPPPNFLSQQQQYLAQFANTSENIGCANVQEKAKLIDLQTEGFTPNEQFVGNQLVMGFFSSLVSLQSQRSAVINRHKLLLPMMQ